MPSNYSYPCFLKKNVLKATLILTTIVQKWIFIRNQKVLMSIDGGGTTESDSFRQTDYLILCFFAIVINVFDIFQSENFRLRDRYLRVQS